MGQHAQNQQINEMPVAALLHSIAEAGRCLGVAQEKGDTHAIVYWSAKVDELVAKGMAIYPKKSNMKDRDINDILSEKANPRDL